MSKNLIDAMIAMDRVKTTVEMLHLSLKELEHKLYDVQKILGEIQKAKVEDNNKTNERS